MVLISEENVLDVIREWRQRAVVPGQAMLAQREIAERLGADQAVADQVAMQLDDVLRKLVRDGRLTGAAKDRGWWVVDPKGTPS